jgi:hypothetical protein
VGRWLLTPAHGFDEARAPPAPDYSQDLAWSMLPGRGDSQVHLPPGAVGCDDVCDAVDVFYLHPTTWYTSQSWNAPALHPVTAYLSDDAIGVQQATAFALGRIFAPRYRQMAAASFLQPGGFANTSSDAARALALALSDVRAAFRHFLQRHWDGRRGIVVAGHSQGSLLAERIVKEFFDGQPLQRHLVAAYLPGWTVFKSSFSGSGALSVRPCRDATSLGCVASWRTFERGADTTLFLHVEPPTPADARVCTNPISWDEDGSHQPATRNLGGLDLMHPRTMVNYLAGRRTAVERVELPAITPHVADAECRDGNLFVQPLPRVGLGWGPWPAWLFAAFPGPNLHTYDLNLFFNSVRANVVQRARVFRARSASPEQQQQQQQQQPVS